MYQPSILFRNPHISTIYPSMFRKVEGVVYDRERISTRDDDFLDLDWIRNGNKSLVIVSHGLEGSSSRPYVLGTAKLFAQNNWDVLAWNCRSCSGEMNKKLKLYHHGATEDLHDVVSHVVDTGQYENIFLAGYSMGGSLTTKFLSELEDNQNKCVIGGAAISTPFDVQGSAEELNKPGRAFYRKRFLKKLKNKLIEKSKQFPGKINVEGIDEIDTFEELDNRYSAPLNGFENADQFYHYVSAGNYLNQVKKPLYILSAKNDPILSPSCFPVSQSKTNDLITLEITRYGGHVGFLNANSEFSYADNRSLKFTETLIP